MAQNGKVNPDCSYAANPDHECTETCLRKIREAPPQKNKKSSGVVPLKFGWKNRGSKPEPPPVRDRISASKVRASSRPEKKKLETKTNVHVSSEAVSTEKYIQDVMDSEDDWQDYEDFYEDWCICWSSPLTVVFVLGVVIYVVTLEAISSFGMSIPSQLHWLLHGFLLMILFFRSYMLLYSYAQPPTTTPRPNAGAAAVTPHPNNGVAVAEAVTTAANTGGCGVA